MSNYTTKPGDMWDLISYRLTGSSEQTAVLMQANPEHTRTFIFPAGVELNVPELDSIVDYSSLPPWKQE